MNFNELRKIDVSEHIEKKNNLSYLSWAYAVDELLQKDSDATWEYRFFDYEKGQVPYCRIGESCMVFCTVNAFGKARTAQLPVMDHRNKAIQNPDSFQVNTAMQRCLAKAISLHGIGLYIYAGEDLPEQDKDSHGPNVTPIQAKAISMEDIKKQIATLDSEDAVRKFFPTGASKLNAMKGSDAYKELTALCQARIAELKEAVAA